MDLVEVIRQESLLSENKVTTHIVEVYHKEQEPISLFKPAELVDVVRPGGTVVNVGAGPVLPEHPYEGQIWIKT